MPLDVIRLVDSDLFALSTGEEFKAAVTLWCKSWLQLPAASLPDDDRILAYLSGAGPRWRKVREVALRGWVKCADGRLYHPVVAEKASDAWARRGDWQEKQENKNDRQRRWRDRVKAISAELRGLGVTPPSNASLSTLDRLLVDAKLSTVGKNETALTGTGTGTSIPLDKSNGAEARFPDPEKVMFDSGVSLLGEAGVGPGKARSVLGKWRRDHGAAAVIEALGAAQRGGIVDPIPWIEGRWKAHAGGQDDDAW